MYYFDLWIINVHIFYSLLFRLLKFMIHENSPKQWISWIFPVCDSQSLLRYSSFIFFKLTQTIFIQWFGLDGVAVPRGSEKAMFTLLVIFPDISKLKCDNKKNQLKIDLLLRNNCFQRSTQYTSPIILVYWTLLHCLFTLILKSKISSDTQYTRFALYG